MSQDRVTRKMLVLLPALRCFPVEEVVAHLAFSLSFLACLALSLSSALHPLSFYLLQNSRQNRWAVPILFLPSPALHCSTPFCKCYKLLKVGRQEDPIPGWHDWKRDFASRISSEVKPKGNSNFL